MGSKRYRNRAKPGTPSSPKKTWTPPVETEKDRTIKAYIRECTRDIRARVNTFVANVRKEDITPDEHDVKFNPLLRAVLCNVVNAFGIGMANNSEQLDALPGGFNIERQCAVLPDSGPDDFVQMEQAFITPGAVGLTAEELKVPLVIIRVMQINNDLESHIRKNEKVYRIGDETPMRMAWNRWIEPVPDEAFRRTEVLVPLVYLMSAAHIGVYGNPSPEAWQVQMRDGEVDFVFHFKPVEIAPVVACITIRWDTIVDMVKRAAQATRPH